MLYLSFGNKCEAQRTHFIVDSLTTLIDGSCLPYNQVNPGDTVFLSGGQKNFLLIRNFRGEPGNPIVFLNHNGIIIINTDHYFGVSVENCQYFRITGTGNDNNFYGFQIDRVSNGSGIGIGKLSSDFELDHVSIKNVSIGAIYAKTDPDCNFNSTRDKFTQFNTIIHDNYIENAGNEGMYIGSTKYFGQTVTCNGTDTLLLPSLLDGVVIYNNIVNYSCWDGIQVSSASNNCRIFDNMIMFDSQSNTFGQMSGIMLGGGSKCDCFNNYITDGNGDGIESLGLGGYRVFNNIIVNAGRAFYPGDQTQMKYGIFISDISIQPDSSFFILFNDIINPKSDGIRFTSVKSKNSLIESNAIINPGTFNYYENGNFGVKGIDSYVMVTDKSADLSIKNNYFARTPDSAGFVASGYALLPGSPLIDAAYPDARGITFDFYHHVRPYGSEPDIGAFEYNPIFLGAVDHAKPQITADPPFPNPVRNLLTFKVSSYSQQDISLDIYNLQGVRISHELQKINSTDLYVFTFDTGTLPVGVYPYNIRSGKQVVSGKFIKIN